MTPVPRSRTERTRGSTRVRSRLRERSMKRVPVDLASSPITGQRAISDFARKRASSRESRSGMSTYDRWFATMKYGPVGSSPRSAARTPISHSDALLQLPTQRRCRAGSVPGASHANGLVTSQPAEERRRHGHEAAQAERDAETHRTQSVTILAGEVESSAAAIVAVGLEISLDDRPRPRMEMDPAGSCTSSPFRDPGPSAGRARLRRPR